MSNSYMQGIQRVQDNQAEIRNNIYVVASNWFVNRCPLVTRVPRVPVGSTTFTTLSRPHRPRLAVVRRDAIASDVEIFLEDASYLMNGDVLEMVSGERIELLDCPSETHDIYVRRGVEGTISGPVRAEDVIRLIGNSRSGSEIDQNGISFKPVGVTQFCQTFQHPVQVGGSLQSSTSYETPKGTRTPFEQYKMEALQNLMDDMECSSYYGRGEDPAVMARPKQKGLRTLLRTNLTTDPVNARAYGPTDFVRDTLQKCRAHGGDPDVLLLSPDFMVGLATWNAGVQRVDAGKNVFGTPINVFEVPFLGGVTIIEAPLLWPGTAIALTSSEVRMRMKRNEFWNPRGVRGDAYEGDWIAEGAIEVDNPDHHAWVEGIRAFAKG